MLWQARVLASAITLVVLFAALLLGPGAAWAQLTATASIDSTTGDYTASFKETGLGNTPITYELTAGTANFYYECFSLNGSPSNPVTSSNPGLLSFVTLTPRKSNITGSLNLSDETVLQLCQDNGLKLCLVGATYSEVTLEDTTTPVGPVSLPALSVGAQYSNTPLECFNSKQCLGVGVHCSKSTDCCSGLCGSMNGQTHSVCF